jgi:hypothetical protein
MGHVGLAWMLTGAPIEIGIRLGVMLVRESRLAAGFRSGVLDMREAAFDECRVEQLTHYRARAPRSQSMVLAGGNRSKVIFEALDHWPVSEPPKPEPITTAA